MAGEPFLKKVWQVIKPLLIYYLMQMIVTMGFSLYIMATKTIDQLTSTSASNQEAVMTEYMNAVLSNTYLITAISAALAIPWIWRLYKKNQKMQNYRVVKGSISWKYYIPAAICGMASSWTASAFVSLIQREASGDGVIAEYGELMDSLYSAPAFLQILAAGFLVPILEELIFRGVIYQQLKRFLNKRMAMLYSALLFGIYHGNLVQGIYAFILGLMMVYIYERYKNIAAPIVFHCSVNALSVILSMFIVEPSYYVLAASAIICVAIALLSFKYVMEHVWAEVITEESDAPAEDEGMTFADLQETDEAVKTDTAQKKTFNVEDYYPKSKDDHEED